MTERSPQRSFLVRIYRFDPADSSMLAGLVEAIDGSGGTTPFADPVELGRIMRDYCVGDHLPGRQGPGEENGTGAR